MELEKHIVDEVTGITYTLQGDYYLPDLTAPEQETNNIGKYGRMRRSYLKEHKQILYSSLLISCKLNGYLHEIDEKSQELFLQLVKELAEKENVNESLKAKDQMEWVARINNIRSRAEGIILAEYVYA